MIDYEKYKLIDRFNLGNHIIKNNGEIIPYFKIRNKISPVNIIQHPFKILYVEENGKILYKMLITKVDSSGVINNIFFFMVYSLSNRLHDLYLFDDTGIWKAVNNNNENILGFDLLSFRV